MDHAPAADDSCSILRGRNVMLKKIIEQSKKYILEKKACLRGSYTVEGALVFSMTFFILAALLIVTFYVHDRAVIQAVTCEAASAGSNFLTAKERSATAAKVKKQLGQKRLLGSRNLSGNAAAGSKEVVASWKAVYPVPGMVMKYFSGSQLRIQTQWNGKILKPSDTIRKIRGAGALLGGGDQ